MRSKKLPAAVGITEQNISLLKSGKVKGIRFETLAKICAALECQPDDILEARPKPLRRHAALKTIQAFVDMSYMTCLQRLV